MTNTPYQESLEKLQEYLVSRGWDTLLEPQNQDTPYTRLEVRLYTVLDGKNRFWPVELAFLPGLENDLKGFSLLQCYVPVIAEVPEASHASISSMITIINPKLAIGQFGLLAKHNLLCFKHNTILENNQVAPFHPALNEMLNMIHYLLESFHDAFLSVIKGETTVQESIGRLPFKEIYD